MAGSGKGSTRRGRTALTATVLGVCTLALAACGGSTKVTSGTTTTSSAPSTTTTTAAAAGGVTIATATVADYGTVMVNGSGRTLYLLTSEQGGKITCTGANGCTTYWPATVLPSGASSARAGTGAQASLLGTVKGSNGSLYVTYGGWPLYTYSGDSAAGQANGEGVSSFGGTWYVIDASGHAVTAKTSGGSSSTTTSVNLTY